MWQKDDQHLVEGSQHNDPFVGGGGVRVPSRPAASSASIAGAMRQWSSSSESSSGPTDRVTFANGWPEALVFAGVMVVQYIHQPQHVLADGPPLPARWIRRCGQLGAYPCNT